MKPLESFIIVDNPIIITNYLTKNQNKHKADLLKLAVVKIA